MNLRRLLKLGFWRALGKVHEEREDTMEQFAREAFLGLKTMMRVIEM